MLSTGDSLYTLRTYKLKCRKRRTVFLANSKQKRTFVAIVISEIVDFKSKTCKYHYISVAVKV